MSHSKHRGSAPIVVVGIALIVIVGVLGYVFWRNVFQSQQSTSNVTIATFEECKKDTGSKIRETFPEQCVTAAGVTFTGPGSSEAVSLTTYCTAGEKLCFDYPDNWKIDVNDTTQIDNPTFNGDKLTLADSTDKLTLYLQSGIDGIGGTCGTNETSTIVVGSTVIPNMSGFKTDFEDTLDNAYVTKVITEDETGKYTANLYITNSKQFSTKGEITEVSGLCFSQLLYGRNVKLASDYEGSGAFLFGLSSNFFGEAGTAPTYDTVEQAKEAYDSDVYAQAEAILDSLRYE